jgi:hypothetical protein
MDTDDLTDMAYRTLIMAESINHIITVEIGAISNCYEDEDSYLKGILKHIRGINKSTDNYIKYWNLESDITSEQLRKGINNIERHILNTLSIQTSLRGQIQ